MPTQRQHGARQEPRRCANQIEESSAVRQEVRVHPAEARQQPAQRAPEVPGGADALTKTRPVERYLPRVKARSACFTRAWTAAGTGWCRAVVLRAHSTLRSADRRRIEHALVRVVDLSRLKLAPYQEKLISPLLPTKARPHGACQADRSVVTQPAAVSTRRMCSESASGLNGFMNTESGSRTGGTPASVCASMTRCAPSLPAHANRSQCCPY